jgi:hypothetical protein
MTLIKIKGFSDERACDLGDLGMSGQREATSLVM